MSSLRLRASLLCSALVLCGLLRAESLSVGVHLTWDGSAIVSEVWDIKPYHGTEWYLVRSNLGDIRIEDFSVSDETGLRYTNIGAWDVDRSLGWKAGKCGIVSKSNGVELCWGLGSYGHHVYTVKYTMTGAVKSMQDYDKLHLQLVSPGIQDVPSDVQVRLSADFPLSSDNARIWGFGYNGSVGFVNGAVEAASTDFDSRSSVILLLRLDKGLLTPSSVEDKPFEETLNRAMEGADFTEEETSGWEVFLGMLVGLLFGGLAIYGGVKAERKRMQKLTGYRRIKDIPWHRDAPFKGDIMETAYALKEVERTSDIGAIASSMILKMIKGGQIEAHSEGSNSKKIFLTFNDQALGEDLPTAVRQLYGMLKEAAGKDLKLQDKEFSRWNRSHMKTVTAWVKTLESDARSEMVSDEYMSLGGTFSDSGKAQTAGAIGLRKFLKDFTLIDERRSAEAVVWDQYLIFGALFGIADKVAKELSDINPQMFQETFLGSEVAARNIILMSNDYGHTITNTTLRSASASSAGGFGGHASFGGGGGFSGGGFGGGAR